MPLKCIYRRLGPPYYDFMGFDMGILLLFSFGATLPQLQQMIDVALSNDTMSLCLFKGSAGEWLADLKTDIAFCICIYMHISNRLWMSIGSCISLRISHCSCINTWRLILMIQVFINALKAYMYQSEHRTDGQHSSGPQMSSFFSAHVWNCNLNICRYLSVSDMNLHYSRLISDVRFAMFLWTSAFFYNIPDMWSFFFFTTHTL